MKHKASEHNEQVALVTKLRREGFFVASVPNGGKRDVREAKRLKDEGAMAGIPDLFVVLPGGRMVWIELKTRKGGRVSEAQKEVHARLETLGHVVILGKGAKDAWDQFIEVDDVREVLKMC